MVEWLLDALKEFLAPLLDGLMWLWHQLVWLFNEAATAMVTTLVQALPDGTGVLNPAFKAQLIAVTSVIEYWFPLSAALACAVAWVMMEVGIATVHLVKEWLPGF